MRILVLTLLVATICVACSRQAVAISYNPSLDTACSVIRGGKIKTAWRDELQGKVAEFRSLWDQTGPALMATEVALTGLQPPSQVSARLTLCNIPSQSILGISVNMRYALKSFTAQPVPLRYKVDTLFHEILHKTLAGHVPDDSALLASNANESPCVRSHLHLLAVQKAVLLRLGEESALHDVVDIDGQLPDACYRRAWSIVNKTDGTYLTYLRELEK